MRRIILLAGVLLSSTATAHAGTMSQWPRVSFTNLPINFHWAKDSIPAELIITDPGGCKNARPGGLRVSIDGNGRSGSIATAPCYPVDSLPALPGLRFRAEPSGATNSINLGLLPDLGHYNYKHSYRIRVRFNKRLLFSGSILTSLFWAPASRVWEGTDAFVNYCINGNHTVWSSNLRLYCIDPAVEVGRVTIRHS